jgi:hypothetical protein
VGNQGTLPAALDRSLGTASERPKRSLTSTTSVAALQGSPEKKGKEEDALYCNGRNRLRRGDEMVSLVAATCSGSNELRWISFRSRSAHVIWIDKLSTCLRKVSHCSY